MHDNPQQNVLIQTACGRESAVRVGTLVPATVDHKSPLVVTLRPKTLGSLLTHAGRTRERTHTISPITPVAFALPDAIRLSTITVGAGGSSENLGENNESEKQIQSFKCKGSHFIALSEQN